MKMSIFSLAGWFVAGGALMLLLFSSTLVFISGYTVGESVCDQPLSGRL